jgi:diguanylate cyclase (GGDEF)-like protein
MNHFTKPKLDTGKINCNVHSELIDILYKQIIHMLWAEAFAGALIFFILWWHGDRILLSVWIAAMVLLTGLPRYYIVHARARTPKENKHNRFWERVLMLLLFLSGLGWAFAGTVLLPLDNYLDESVVLFLLVGVAAAANPFYSPVKKMYAVFLLPTLFVSAFYLLIKGSGYAVFVGIALLAFGMLMLITSIISSELITKTLRLRFQNLELTKNLMKSNVRLENLASHDMLTNLPNRPFFYEALQDTIADAKKQHKSFALLFLDLDKFKKINDSLGHDTGDQLLQAVAERLTHTIRPMDIACRLGGDEFIILLLDIENPTVAASIAQQVCKALAAPIKIKTHPLSITTSIGISIFPDDGTDRKTLIHKADTAMYHTKNHSKGGFHFYNSKMNARNRPESQH